MPPADLQISLQDIAGFMEAVSNVEEKQLDLIIHSPGGSAEAAESIVTYLRKRFDHIRIFIPIAAMSAATMVALSANEIVMGQHSQLGPIDPQFSIQTPEGTRSAPAQAILKQFELAKKECKEAQCEETHLTLDAFIISVLLDGVDPISCEHRHAKPTDE